ncbi:unnamed protein product [Phytophthora fragariaefolia]|uniref:Unnamed protein product n=1 Tax=Phytophthora fragariaefolia TaxID=1490495 RepID=A0A9W6TY32_9STRA|nr:unnamed protein product [Phytophthora fragariaefolia]
MSKYIVESAACCAHEINGRAYDFLYYLAEGIYPDWRYFVKTISSPMNDYQTKAATLQESVRKDVERTFGVLQARFAVVARSARTWSLDTIKKTMKCCVILHNMIIDDDQRTGRAAPRSKYAYFAGYGYARHSFQFQRLDLTDAFPYSLTVKYRRVMDSTDHFRLKRDLMEHIAGLP